jgi:hypothetical protein
VRSLYIFDQGLSLEIVLLAIEKPKGNTDLAESLTPINMCIIEEVCIGRWKEVFVTISEILIHLK